MFEVPALPSSNEVQLETAHMDQDSVTYIHTHSSWHFNINPLSVQLQWKCHKLKRQWAAGLLSYPSAVSFAWDQAVVLPQSLERPSSYSTLLHSAGNRLSWRHIPHAVKMAVCLIRCPFFSFALRVVRTALKENWIFKTHWKCISLKKSFFMDWHSFVSNQMVSSI